MDNLKLKKRTRFKLKKFSKRERLTVDQKTAHV